MLTDLDALFARACVYEKNYVVVCGHVVREKLANLIQHTQSAGCELRSLRKAMQSEPAPAARREKRRGKKENKETAHSSKAVGTGMGWPNEAAVGA